MGTDLLSAPQNVVPETPVAHEAEQGISECRGPVVLKKVVSHPSERVTLEDRRRDEPRTLRDRSGDEQHSRDARADEVQSAAHGIGVFAQVERIEIGECTEPLRFAHGVY